MKSGGATRKTKKGDLRDHLSESLLLGGELYSSFCLPPFNCFLVFLVGNALLLVHWISIDVLVVVSVQRPE